MGMLQNVRDILYIVNGGSEGGGGGEAPDAVTHEELNTALARKQNTLTFDPEAIHGSNNVVSSNTIAKGELRKRECVTSETMPDGRRIVQLDNANITAIYGTLADHNVWHGHIVPKAITFYRRQNETPPGVFYLRILRYSGGKWRVVSYSKNAICPQWFGGHGDAMGPWEMVMVPGEPAIPTDEKIAMTFVTDLNQPATQTSRVGLKVETQSRTNLVTSDSLSDGKLPRAQLGRAAMTISYTFSINTFIENPVSVSVEKFNQECQKVTQLQADVAQKQPILIPGANVSITDGPDTPDGKKRQTISVTGGGGKIPQATSTTLGGIKVAEKDGGNLASSEMSPGLLINKDSGYLNLNLLPNGGLKYNTAGYFQLCVNFDEVASAESVRVLQSQVSAANTKLEETV